MARVALTFTLRDGRTIRGVGPLPSGISACRGPLAGSLQGPASGDSGDWLTSPNTTLLTGCVNPCISQPRHGQACYNFCFIQNNFVGTGAAFDSCITACNNGDPSTYSYTCLDGTSSPGGGVTPFFGTGCTGLM